MQRFQSMIIKFDASVVIIANILLIGCHFRAEPYHLFPEDIWLGIISYDLAT